MVRCIAEHQQWIYCALIIQYYLAFSFCLSNEKFERLIGWSFWWISDRFCSTSYITSWHLLIREICCQDIDCFIYFSYNHTSLSLHILFVFSRRVQDCSSGSMELKNVGNAQYIRAGIAQSVDRLPGLTLWGSGMIDPGLQSHQCLFASMWMRMAWLPCWPPSVNKAGHFGFET